MASLHLFNPDNDIALARDVDNFTAPTAARDIRHAGSTLPMWYGTPGDRIIARGVSARWYDSVEKLFSTGIDVIGDSSPDTFIPSPWGWSKASRRDFIRLGMAPALLPDDSTLDRLRMLSHRRTAISVVRCLEERLPFAIATPAVEARDEKQIADFFDRNNAVIAKEPWSCSGRGIMDSRSVPPKRMAERMAAIIRNQGSVMLEHAYDKTCDFAILINCNDGRAVFEGLSLFDTGANGDYHGNILDSNDRLADRIAVLCDRGHLDALVDTLAGVIGREIAPRYNGPVGVDMITTSGNGQPEFALVEINLRMTMGFVARRFHDRYMADGSTGRYSVTPRQTIVSPLPDAVTDSHRLVSGTVTLNPEGRFAFTVEAMEK